MKALEQLEFQRHCALLAVILDRELDRSMDVVPLDLEKAIQALAVLSEYAERGSK